MFPPSRPSTAPIQDAPVSPVLGADEQGLYTLVPSLQKVADGDCGRGLVLRGHLWGKLTLQL